MTERKPWTNLEDQHLIDLINSECYGTGQKLRWGEISRQLQSVGSKRSGKQCRERWFNQLRPGINIDREWSAEQQKILFKEQEQHGNRWSLIARALPGRTENSIKNYFYSALRKALRRVNTYVSTRKKQQRYKNVKEFKPQNLSKILSVSQQKYQQKINLKSSMVVNDAIKIKKLLVQILLDQRIGEFHQKCDLLAEIVGQIQEFNRNCKRRKGKKKDEGDLKGQYADSDCYIEESFYQKCKCKDKANTSKEKEIPEKNMEIKEIERRDTNRNQQSVFNVFDQDIFAPYDNFENEKEKIDYESVKNAEENHHFRRNSSSSDNKFSIISSEKYCSDHYYCGLMSDDQYPNQQIQGSTILDSIIPVYEAKKAQQYNSSVFFKETHPAMNNSQYLDQSRGYNIFEGQSSSMSNIFMNQFQMSQKDASHCQKQYDNNQIQ